MESIFEEKILTYLVENYRKSKKDSGKNKLNRRTQVKPSRFYKKYYSSEGSYESIQALNEAVERLADNGFITFEREQFGTQIQVIYFIDSQIERAEQYLSDAVGYVSKDDKLLEMKRLVQLYKGASFICTKECEKIEELIKVRKPLPNCAEKEDILKALAFLENNTEWLYIREASMKIYGDSKYLEAHTLKSVCALLEDYYGNQINEEFMKTQSESEAVVPASFRVIRMINGTKKFWDSFEYERFYSEAPQTLDEEVAICKEEGSAWAVPHFYRGAMRMVLAFVRLNQSPSKLAIKGRVVITINGVRTDISGFKHGIEFSGSDLASIDHIGILDKTCMTVENKTAYIRYEKADTTCIFLSGFATHDVTTFLSMIYRDNPTLDYLHFGDIDAGGFFIHGNLCEATGIKFGLHAMSTAELTNPEYSKSLRTLTPYDILRLKCLKDNPIYKDTVLYMLEHNVKLEQEIVCLDLMSRK